MTSPPYDPSQQNTQIDPLGPNPYAYGQAAGAHPQPPYSPPVYPHLAYPQPVHPAYGYAAAGPSGQTNTMAILSLVFAFVFAPLAIVFGHVSKTQIRASGEQGDGLATAGLVLGYIFTGLYLVGCALFVVVEVFAASVASSGN